MNTAMSIAWVIRDCVDRRGLVVLTVSINGKPSAPMKPMTEGKAKAYITPMSESDSQDGLNVSMCPCGMKLGDNCKC